MAVETYTVFGAAFLNIRLGSAAIQTLGYTEQGVDMDITEAKEEVLTDLMGTKVPQDFQDMGMMARIIAPLIALDDTVLRTIINRGDRSTFGQVNSPGLVLGATGYYFGLGIVSGATGLGGTGTYTAPWYFPYCLLRAPGTRLATKANPMRLEIVAWPLASYTASSGKNTTLFTRALP